MGGSFSSAFSPAFATQGVSGNNWERILRILFAPFATLEAAAQQNATMRFVTNATGETLTLIGKIVGQEREGVTNDDLFRRYVQAKIATNSSDGTPEEMYTISRLIVTETGVTFELDNQGIAAFVMGLRDAAVPWEVAEILIKFLRRARNGGVRVIVEWQQSAPSGGFRFASVDLADPATGLGFESYDTLTGGAMASAIE